MNAAIDIRALTAPERPFKCCGRCGRGHSVLEWNALRFVGEQVLPGEDGCAAEIFELRDCACGSTLAAIFPPIPKTDMGQCPLCIGERVFEDRSVVPFITVPCANHS